ncbi:SURF1 family protein [Pseudooceanicola sp. CBS1P-1]|uniref:SURF1-like protein n=1 Tax=Pseudooceanicola albus TaxID=2692189 RepID=A0A6L7FZI2_9RHOB|nr:MULTISPECIES: SURF1 family protein [Pseudooceanicola]MBT9382682.1 SURF1 family protein [Pseudooceanicola endophyticus]MXN17221.1 SURF1 family protein [Pseudooceanicola albus]
MRIWSVLVLGLGGAAILLSLGSWQLRRLAWKEDLLARIETRIAAAPVALPRAPDPERDRYLAVSAEGHFTGAPLRVQSARDGQGAGWRIVQRFDTAGRRIMVDRGFVPQGAEIPEGGAGRVTGNLLWPDEVDAMTPRPDLEDRLFYGRDVSGMADVLATEPVLLVRRDGAGGGGVLRAAPVGTGGIRNDHKEYAVTWFALAAVWLVMTAYLFYRMRKQEKGETS